MSNAIEDRGTATCRGTFSVVEMAAKEPIVVESIDDGIAEPGIEPGASMETMLVTTDSFDEYEQEMSSSIDGDRQMKDSTTSTISEIQEDVAENIPTIPTAASPPESEKNLSLDDGEMVRLLCEISSAFFIQIRDARCFCHPIVLAT